MGHRHRPRIQLRASQARRGWHWGRFTQSLGASAPQASVCDSSGSPVPGLWWRRLRAVETIELSGGEHHPNALQGPPTRRGHWHWVTRTPVLSRNNAGLANA
ncbi:hypothetical protein TGAMA5MH_01198 [Trichoderma gamsii]|uniref:Uncharacterized protein n=1 Tax=Trichoderma gamsii TaxID=398673 RepID=A0A2K0TPC6_9HYPO|nr:hypothetical protein TGAMA5MH_01198 [Trichoderma gamsii]